MSFRKPLLVILGCSALCVIPGNLAGYATGTAWAQDSVVAQKFLLGWTADDTPFGEFNLYDLTTARHLAMDTTGGIHFLWPDVKSTPKRINYNRFFEGVVAFGDTGCSYTIDPTGFVSGKSSLALDGDTPVFVMVGALPGSSPGVLVGRGGTDCDWSLSALTPYDHPYSLPSLAANPGGGETVYHALAHTVSSYSGGLGYWRWTDTGATTFSTVDSAIHQSKIVVTSPVSEKVAVVLGGRYYESSDNGLTWGVGDQFGAVHSFNPGTGSASSAAYDYDDNLHIIVREVIPPEEFDGTPYNLTRLHHWSESTGMTPITQALWNSPYNPWGSRNLERPQLAVGIGERLNNLYVLWEQVGSNSSDSDRSVRDNLNSDLYLAISPDGGATWGAGHNITNTQSPGCDGDCKNEVTATMGQVVDSLVHIFYQQDLEPGDDLLSGTPATINPVYYLRLQTPEPSPVPQMGELPDAIPLFSFPVGGVDSVLIHVENPGALDLSYTFSDTMSWLRFADAPDSDSGTIAVGGAAEEVTVIVDGFGLDEGYYSGHVFLSSDAPLADGRKWQVGLTVTSDSTREFQIERSRGSDCWGWTAPDGSEYAIMGTKFGVAFINVATRRIVGFVNAPTCTHRDMKTYRNFCYAVSECGPGMMIIDLQYLPDSVHLVDTFVSGGRDSHNISIDTARGYAYPMVVGMQGFRVISLADPVAPVELAPVITGGGSTCHDVFARNDTVWAAEGDNHRFSIWNSPTRMLLPSSLKSRSRMLVSYITSGRRRTVISLPPQRKRLEKL